MKTFEINIRSLIKELTVKETKVHDSECKGEGSITLAFNQDIPMDSIVWSNGEKGPEVFNLYPGNYSVTIHHGKCIQTYSFDIYNDVNGVDCGAFIRNVWTTPNPASDYLRVHWNTKREAPVHFMLTTVQGEILQSKFLNSVKGYNSYGLDVRELPVGLYFISLATEGELKTQKFIIMK